MTADEEIDLLGGAQRRATRVRGFSPWRPQRRAQALLEQVRAVLDEYANYLPLTVRQIFYRLVGAHEFEKTQKGYARLCDVLNRARRARLIEMNTIRDDGGNQIVPPTWEGADDFLDEARKQASTLQLDRLTGQRKRLAVMCEAAGMAPQLARIAGNYGLPVISSGGFESTTERFAFARQVAEDDRPVEVLHIGDHDPSGAHMFLALAEDVSAFARELGGDVSFSRLAVTPEQIVEMGLPTALPKFTDRRAFNGDTCQAEAIPPDVLAQILNEAIRTRIDHTALQTVLNREEIVRAELVGQLNLAGGAL